jgi:hypothetical protein
MKTSKGAAMSHFDVRAPLPQKRCSLARSEVLAVGAVNTGGHECAGIFQVVKQRIWRSRVTSVDRCRSSHCPLTGLLVPPVRPPVRRHWSRPVPDRTFRRQARHGKRHPASVSRPRTTIGV